MRASLPIGGWKTAAPLRGYVDSEAGASGGGGGRILAGSFREAGRNLRGRFGDDSGTIRGRFEVGSRAFWRRKRRQTAPATPAMARRRARGEREGWVP